MKTTGVRDGKKSSSFSTRTKCVESSKRNGQNSTGVPIPWDVSSIGFPDARTIFSSEHLRSIFNTITCWFKRRRSIAIPPVLPRVPCFERRREPYTRVCSWILNDNKSSPHCPVHRQRGGGDHGSSARDCCEFDRWIIQVSFDGSESFREPSPLLFGWRRKPNAAACIFFFYLSPTVR